MREMLQAAARFFAGALRLGAGRPRTLAAPLAALLLAAPAWSAEIVDVRIGRHPEFTRIVFELDQQTGYRIKRTQRDLIVTLEATSKAWSIGRRGSVESVQVDAGATESVAKIRLRNTDVRVQEMILANPARIVLDLKGEVPVAPPAAAKPSAEKPVSRPAPQPVVKKPVSRPAPQPVVEKPVARPAPEPVVEKPVARPAPQPVVEKPVARPAPEPLVEKPIARPVPEMPRAPAPAPEPDVPLDIEPMPSFVKVAPAPPAPKPVVAPPKPPKPMVASGIQGAVSKLLANPMLLGGGAAAAIVVIALLVVVLRRRRAIPNDLDVTAIAGDADAAGSGAVAGAEDDLFGDLDSALADAGAAETRTRSSIPPSGSSIFDDDDPMKVATSKQGDAQMKQDLSDMPTSATAARSSSTGSGDMGRIVRELQSRMAALETKLEEANEARERLERQVAAQSEELRVQRAAIARTQRALRSMSRSDDDKASEPALRDGETQMKTRVNG